MLLLQQDVTRPMLQGHDETGGIEQNYSGGWQVLAKQRHSLETTLDFGKCWSLVLTVVKRRTNENDCCN